MTVDDLDSAIEESHAALTQILNGNPEGYRTLFSDREDVTLGNPFGPFARGPGQVAATLAGAASHYQDGEALGFELIAKHATDELACVVEVERGRAKIDGSDDLATFSLRVTSLFRAEDGTWRLVHRHADPITSPRSGPSIIEQ